VTLTDTQFELFQFLTQRTLLVLDTEYTPDPSGNGDRVISLALVPVVRGKRTTVGELYIEMNPGVPIDPATTLIHGFTDAAVARKRRFAHYAERILAALAQPNAVLVAHTGADLRVLRRELERLDETHAAGDPSPAPGLADLPTLPLLDTSTLPRMLRYPGVGNRGVISLATLCQLTGVRNASAHHARHDARATADATIKLLLHAAGSAFYDSLDALLADHGRGTSTDPRTAGYIGARRDRDPVLPTEHLARHDRPLTHTGSAEERTAWLELAADCARLRCEHLRGEAALAAPANGAALLDGLTALLPRLTEAGQPGTLLGAVAALITPSDDQTSPALAHTRALRWWAKQRPAVNASAACGPVAAQRCPDCRADGGCPRHVLYQPVARIAILGERGRLGREVIHDRLFGNRPDRRIHKWPARHPEVAAFMAATVVAFERGEGRPTAAIDHLRVAIDKGLHLLDPRLALLACEYLLGTEGADPAVTVAQQALAARTSDPAYRDLHDWLVLHHQQIAVVERHERAPRVIRH
jgi:DNA polymerase III epsilon subunit-like protein